MTESNDTDEPDRSPTPQPQLETEGDDQPPPSTHSDARPLSIELEISDATSTLSDDELRMLHDMSTRVLAQLPNSGSVRARIVNDEAMIEAHQRFCDLGTTTDVLTFDLADSQSDPACKVLDTDLIVCLDEARRQAAQRAHTPAHELLLYIVHGVLHCLGHDDHTQEEYKRMHAREDELLSSAGIGALFHNEPSQQQESKS